MRTTVGITFLVIGLIAVLPIGLPKLFSNDESDIAIAMFLVFGGMMASLTGSGLVRFYFDGSLRTAKLLFGVCFVVSTALMIAGLVSVFSNIGVSVYLLVVGFMGAVVSALALK
ncbi:MAG TPA: hypothetical protein VI547_15850 [Anaerolineales bacterium]|nr:hypothetical protein [Anaerolineales bacterium]